MDRAGEPAEVKSAAEAALRELDASDLRMKSVFTTGEVADLCQISQQTVIRCFDSGRLKGFRVPGSKFRRIPRDALVTFMKSNRIPLDRLEEATGKIRVLVVDDTEAIVSMLRSTLEHDGRFEVQSAATGYDAGLLTAEFRPDVILLDYMLPDINGNVVCQRIRANPDFAEIRIIIVSGVVRESEIAALMSAGANAFIKKPFDLQQLMTKIVELVCAA